MNRTLKELNNQQQAFVDAVFLQAKTYPQTAELLGIDLPTVRQLYQTLAYRWRPLILIRNKWKSEAVGGNFWDFCHWFLTAEKRCRYCSITQEALDQLHASGLSNKRTTRGRALEIDRKIAGEPYSNLSNLTWCCYWCNNAKTDTFSEAEFQLIGKAIGAVWKQRLEK